MSIIRIDDFAGLNLRQDPKKGSYAQVAENVDLDTNAIVPSWGLDVVSRVLVGTVSEKKTIYHLFGTTFVTWTQDVQVAANPLADNSDRRIYYTGDGEPRVTNYSRVAAGAPPYVLGIPSFPAIASTYSAASGGTGLDQDRAYVYTYVTPWGEEGPPSTPMSIVAKETGATVSLDRIGVSTFEYSGNAPLIGFVAGTPGYLEINMGIIGNVGGLTEGERIYLGRSAAGPGTANRAYVISYVSGAIIRIAANCWPFADVNPRMLRVLPINEFVLDTNCVSSAGDHTQMVLTLKTEPIGLRVGEQINITGAGLAALNGTQTIVAVDVEKKQVKIAWDGTNVMSNGGTAKRVGRHNTGEVKITGVSFAASVATITVEDTAELVVNDRVLIVGLMGSYELNGVRQIVSIPDATHITVSISAVTAYTSGGVLVRPIPYAFDEYTVTAVAAAAGGPYPTAFTTVITLDRNHTLSVGDLVIGYDIGGAVELNTVLVISAVPAANQITVSMGSSHAAYTNSGQIALVERGAKKRIYRTTQGSTDAEYQLVAEIPGDQCNYTDTQNDANLSSTTLETDEWIAPPTDLHHLQPHPHGFLVGLSGNLLCPSEPVAPHAFPVSLQKAMPVQSAVGLGIIGQSAVVLTTEKPYVFSGSDPTAMAREVVQAGEPCTSGTSIASTESDATGASVPGVAYRGKRGVFLAGPGAATNLTRDILPASFFDSSPRSVGAFWAGKYVWVDNSAKTGYVLDPAGGDHALTQFRVDFGVSTLHVSPVDGQLWASYLDGTNVYAAPLFKVNGNAGLNARFDWQSEYRYLPKPVTLSYLLVDFDWASLPSWWSTRATTMAGNMREKHAGAFNTVNGNMAAWNGSRRSLAYTPDTSGLTPAEKYLKVTVIANPDSSADRVTVFDDFVSSDKPVRIDDSVKADVWQVKLLGNLHVTAVTLASSIDELRAV